MSSPDTTPLAQRLREISEQIGFESRHFFGGSASQVRRLAAMSEELDQLAEQVRVLGHHAEVHKDNFEASEDNIGMLVEALGFETGDGGPMLENVEERAFRLASLARRLVRMGDAGDPEGVEDRRRVTLTHLINEAGSALGIQEGGTGNG